MSDDPPETEVVAAALDVKPDRVERLVEWHPDPTPDALVNMADRPPADPDVRQQIERWLAEHGGGRS